MSTSSVPAPAPTVADLEARQAARRQALAFDVEMLGARLAPASLTAQARDRAQAAVASLRSRSQEAVAASPVAASPLAAVPGATDDGAGPRVPARPSLSTVREAAASVPARVRSLVDDARDGDPAALAVTTGAALLLGALAVSALVRAVRR